MADYTIQTKKYGAIEMDLPGDEDIVIFSLGITQNGHTDKIPLTFLLDAFFLVTPEEMTSASANMLDNIPTLQSTILTTVRQKYRNNLLFRHHINKWMKSCRDPKTLSAETIFDQIELLSIDVGARYPGPVCFFVKFTPSAFPSLTLTAEFNDTFLEGCNIR